MANISNKKLEDWSWLNIVSSDRDNYCKFCWKTEWTFFDDYCLSDDDEEETYCICRKCLLRQYKVRRKEKLSKTTLKILISKDSEDG